MAAKLQRFIVLPRHIVPRVIPRVPYAVVSVTDPGYRTADVPDSHNLHELLRLQFHDFNPPKPGSSIDKSDPAFWSDIRVQSMQRTHAELIWHLAASLPEAVETMIVHCEAGLSRSPSIAMAICDMLKLERSCIAWDGGPSEIFPPNPHVYDTLVETWKHPA